MQDTIKIHLTEKGKPKPNPHELQFGNVFTDHMFMMDYTEELGWHHARIVPYQALTIDPSAKVFHHGQAVFEGLKAYVTDNGRVLLFRPEKNIERMNRSNDRLCMPKINERLALKAVQKLVAIDQEWIPRLAGTSLYIRPFIIATEPSLGVSPSTTYQFIIILSPVGAYYEEGINPVNIVVENEYVRAVPGGTGEAKTSGNYAASLKAQENIAERGFAQVLWLDGTNRKYIEEVGSMNVFFNIAGEVITPKLSGSILEGVTRDSVIELLKHWEIPITERNISIDELYESYQSGILEEAFGTGTAAVISPIGQLTWQGKNIIINEGKTGELSQKLYQTLTNIQYGKIADPFQWTMPVDENI